MSARGDSAANVVRPTVLAGIPGTYGDTICKLRCTCGDLVTYPVPGRPSVCECGTRWSVDDG